MNNIINNFIHGDAFDVFKQMPDQSVNLTFTSLPDISQTLMVKMLRNIKYYKIKRVMKWQEQLKMMVL